MGKDKQDKQDKKESSGKAYAKELLQGELVALQEWVKDQRLRVVVVFEGRDAAGKGGTIKAITERVSPRVFRLVALPAPPTARSRRWHAALPAALSGGRRDRDLRSQLGITAPASSA